MNIEDKFKAAGWTLIHKRTEIQGIFDGRTYCLVSKSFVEEYYDYKEELELAYQKVIEKNLVKL